MQDIFEDEHEPLFYLLSFLFPENLLPASITDNPIRKAYADALEMIYNIEVVFVIFKWNVLQLLKLLQSFL